MVKKDGSRDIVIKTVGDYLQLAGEMLEKGEYCKEGEKSKLYLAYKLLYKNNNVIDIIENKGEKLFVCEL